jgi:hypothetical protein
MSTSKCVHLELTPLKGGIVPTRVGARTEAKELMAFGRGRQSLEQSVRYSAAQGLKFRPTATSPRARAKQCVTLNSYVESSEAQTSLVRFLYPPNVIKKVWFSVLTVAISFSFLAAPLPAQFVYVANNGANTVSGYRIDHQTGALTPVPGSPFATESLPESVTVDPTAQFVYVANNGSNNVLGYHIDRKTGTLKEVPSSLLAAGCGGSSDGPTESARVNRAMTYIREHNQDIASEAGNLGESRPAMPYLLVGARDSKGYRGYANSNPGVEVTSGVANVGSSTKSFTAALILQLDQEGKLSIEDTLADPRWNNVLQWPNGQNITLKMVLAHTAGIPDYEDSTAFATHRLDPNWDPTPEDVIGFARVLPSYFPPGILETIV